MRSATRPSSTLTEREALRWEWRAEPPTVDEVLERLGSLKPVWGIEVADFAEHVLPMVQSQKVKDSTTGRDTGQREAIWRLYFQVAGRVAMLQAAVEEHKWIVTEYPEILEGTGQATVYRVGIEISGVGVIDLGPGANPTENPQPGPTLGIRYGLAALKSSDRVPPWEKMETAARGRAIAAWGFGVLPGSGIASLEEIELAESPDYQQQQPTRNRDLDRDELVDQLRTKMEQLRLIKGTTEQDARRGLVEYVSKTFGRALADDEETGAVDLSSLSPGQLALIVQRFDGWIRDARQAAEVET